MNLASVPTSDLLAELASRRKCAARTTNWVKAAILAAEVASRRGVSFAQLVGPRGSSRVSAVRDEAAVELAAAGYALADIAAVLGRKSHTTVVKMLRRGRQLTP